MTATKDTTAPPAISVKDLVVELGGRQILRSVDVTIRQGEVVALLGANGSGKSTLMKTLVGINPIASGSVRLFGEPLGTQAPWHRIGYVPQRVTAGSGVPATAAEVVTSGLLSGRQLRLPRNSRPLVLDALRKVGLAERADRPVDVLSGGQQQRVLIARAMVRKPDMLLLDEPVSGVDLPSQAAFARVLGTLRDEGTTIVVVLHELGAFQSLLERAVVLRQGVVVHDGAPPQPNLAHAGAEHDHVHPHSDLDPNDPSAPYLSLPGQGSHQGAAS